jgi:regulatory protein
MAESLRSRALKMLARREHTRREIEKKLAADGGDPGEIEAVLNDLEKRGWLSESRVTSSWFMPASRASARAG